MTVTSAYQPDMLRTLDDLVAEDEWHQEGNGHAMLTSRPGEF